MTAQLPDWDGVYLAADGRCTCAGPRPSGQSPGTADAEHAWQGCRTRAMASGASSPATSCTQRWWHERTRKWCGRETNMLWRQLRAFPDPAVVRLADTEPGLDGHDACYGFAHGCAWQLMAGQHRSCAARILDWGPTCTVVNMMDAVMVGLPGATQDRLPADVPGPRLGRPGVPRGPAPGIRGHRPHDLAGTAAAPMGSHARRRSTGAQPLAGHSVPAVRFSSRRDHCRTRWSFAPACATAQSSASPSRNAFTRTVLRASTRTS